MPSSCPPSPSPRPPASRYSEGAEWAHGGPDILEGGGLRRYAKTGADSGGIFLTRASPGQLPYAVTYAKSGLYRVCVDLRSDEVFDLHNEEHLDRIAPVVTNDGTGVDMLQSAFSCGCTDALDWAVIDEDVLRAAGFRGAMLIERPPGVVSDEAIFSLVVFDPDAVRVTGKYAEREVRHLRENVARFIERRDGMDRGCLSRSEEDIGFGAPLRAPRAVEETRAPASVSLALPSPELGE